MVKFTGNYSGCMATRARKSGSKLGTSARVCKQKVFGEKPTKHHRKGRKHGRKGKKSRKAKAHKHSRKCLKVCVTGAR